MCRTRSSFQILEVLSTGGRLIISLHSVPLTALFRLEYRALELARLMCALHQQCRVRRQRLRILKPMRKQLLVASKCNHA